MDSWHSYTSKIINSISPFRCQGKYTHRKHTSQYLENNRRFQSYGTVITPLSESWLDNLNRKFRISMTTKNPLPHLMRLFNKERSITVLWRLPHVLLIALSHSQPLECQSSFLSGLSTTVPPKCDPAADSSSRRHSTHPPRDEHPAGDTGQTRARASLPSPEPPQAHTALARTTGFALCSQQTSVIELLNGKSNNSSY